MSYLARKVALNILNGYKYTITLSTTTGVLVGAYEGLKIAEKETFRGGGIRLRSIMALYVDSRVWCIWMYVWCLFTNNGAKDSL
jgi:hypothetical protein